MSIKLIERGVSETHQEWRESAICVGRTAIFFAEGKEKAAGASREAAKKLCGYCTVRAECLEYAVYNGEKEGIWAGLAPRALRAVRRQANGLSGQEMLERIEDGSITLPRKTGRPTTSR